MSLSLQSPIIPQPHSFVNTFSNSYFSGDDIPNKKSPAKTEGDNLMLGFLISWNLMKSKSLFVFFVCVFLEKV